jgi:uncharacterized protein
MTSTPKNFIAFSEAAAERSDYHIAPEKLIRGNTAQTTLNMFSDSGNEFHCGIWQGAPALWQVSYSEHEFCHILQGRIRITDESGANITVGPGDNFVITAGFKGTWEILEAAKKIYVIFESKTV